MEKKMKWIGLEWRKGGEIGEKSFPETHFFEKTHKTHFPPKKTSIIRTKKAPQGYPPADARWAGGAGPGPNVNSRGQGAGPGPNVNILY